MHMYKCVYASIWDVCHEKSGKSSKIHVKRNLCHNSIFREVTIHVDALAMYSMLSWLCGLLVLPGMINSLMVWYLKTAYHPSHVKNSLCS